MQNEAQKSTEAKAISLHKIEKKYDELLAEREKLQAELKTFKYIDFSILFSSEKYAQNPELKKAIGKWLSRVRNETDYLKPLDALGIQIFTEDLSGQPAFPGIKINFGSKELYDENLADLNKAKGGVAEIRNRTVQIISGYPWLEKQVSYFLKNGVLSESVVTLIHELIHWTHYMRTTRNWVDSVLTESQAYASSDVYQNQLSLSPSYKKLTKNSIYGYEKEKTLTGLLNVTDLQALGVSEADLAAMVAESSYNKEENSFSFIKDKLQELKDQLKLNETDIEALRDLYRLDKINQRHKAQLLLYKTLKSCFDMQKLNKDRLSEIRNTLARPYYYNKGKVVPADELKQRFVCPANEEWPYDSEGIRTGIMFGLAENKDGKFEYQLGKLTATHHDFTFIPAQTPEEQEKLLSVLRQQAPQIKFENKEWLWLETTELYSSEMAIKVLVALVSKEETAEILKKYSDGFKEQISKLLDNLMPCIDSGTIAPEDEDKIKIMITGYSYLYLSLNSVLAAFGKGPEALDPNLESQLLVLEKNITDLKVLYKKTFGKSEGEASEETGEPLKKAV